VESEEKAKTTGLMRFREVEESKECNNIKEYFLLLTKDW
jgi:hypothetical protein